MIDAGGSNLEHVESDYFIKFKRSFLFGLKADAVRLAAFTNVFFKDIWITNSFINYVQNPAFLHFIFFD